MLGRAHVLNVGEMVAPEPSLTDTGPLYNQLSFPSFPVPALPPILYRLVLWGKLVRAPFVLIHCPFFSSGVFSFGLWMQSDHSFCWKNNHQRAAQQVTLFLWSAGESIIRSFLFSLRGKRQWFVPLFRSQKKVKISFSDGFCVWAPRQWWRQLSLPRMAGLLIGIMCEEASPTDTLQLLLSWPPRQVPIRSFHRGLQEAPEESWQANPHIPYALLLSSASAMHLFFSTL